MVIQVKKSDAVEVRCPHCDDFYGYIGNDFFYGPMEKEVTVYCHAGNCGKPFKIIRE